MIVVLTNRLAHFVGNQENFLIVNIITTLVNKYITGRGRNWNHYLLIIIIRICVL